jgi:hypothetical protein
MTRFWGIISSHNRKKTLGNIGMALDEPERTKLSKCLKSEMRKSKKLGIFR